MHLVPARTQNPCRRCQAWVKLQLALGLLLLTILRLYHLPPPLPYPVGNFSSLSTCASPVYQLLYCTTVLFKVSVQSSHSVKSNSLRPRGLQHARPPCPSPTPGLCSNSCPLSWWCHPTISSSVVPFSSCPQSFPASGSFSVSQFFASGGQSIGISASIF